MATPLGPDGLVLVLSHAASLILGAGVAADDQHPNALQHLKGEVREQCGKIRRRALRRVTARMSHATGHVQVPSPTGRDSRAVKHRTASSSWSRPSQTLMTGSALPLPDVSARFDGPRRKC